VSAPAIGRRRPLRTEGRWRIFKRGRIAHLVPCEIYRENPEVSFTHGKSVCGLVGALSDRKDDGRHCDACALQEAKLSPES